MVGAHRRGTGVRAAVVGGLVTAVLGLVGCGTGATSAADDAGDPSATVEDVRRVEQARLRALVEADVPELERVHADGFALVPPPGTLLARDDYLAAVGSGDLDYLEFEPIGDIEVRLLGSAALVTYESHIEVVAAGQGQVGHDTWHTYLYELRDGTWQVVWEQATAVGGFPPPAAT